MKSSKTNTSNMFDHTTKFDTVHTQIHQVLEKQQLKDQNNDTVLLLTNAMVEHLQTKI